MNEILPAEAQRDNTGFYREMAASMQIISREGQVVVTGRVSKTALLNKLKELGDNLGIGLK